MIRADASHCCRNQEDQERIREAILTVSKRICRHATSSCYAGNKQIGHHFQLCGARNIIMAPQHDSRSRCLATPLPLSPSLPRLHAQ